jgi:hypothetical protein
MSVQATGHPGGMGLERGIKLLHVVFLCANAVFFATIGEKHCQGEYADVALVGA